MLSGGFLFRLYEALMITIHVFGSHVDADPAGCRPKILKKGVRRDIYSWSNIQQ